jgi:hypothetical protein
MNNGSAVFRTLKAKGALILVILADVIAVTSSLKATCRQMGFVTPCRTIACPDTPTVTRAPALLAMFVLVANVLVVSALAAKVFAALAALSAEFAKEYVL